MFFSDREAKNVESKLRERLLKSPRVKAFEGRWKIALRFNASEEQQDNFNILNVAGMVSAENLQLWQDSATKIIFLKIEKQHFLLLG